MGWDEADGDAQKRFEEQKERHEGGSKWIGTGGTSPSAPTATTRRASASARDKGRNRSAVKVWDQRHYKDYDDARARHAQHQVALRRLRRFAREGRELELDLDDTIRSTAATPAGWTSRWCPSGTTR